MDKKVIIIVIYVFFSIPLIILAETREIKVGNYSVNVTGTFDQFDFVPKVFNSDDSISILTLRFSSEDSLPPPDIKIQWQVPIHNVAGLWTTEKEYNKETLWRSGFTSRLTTHAPVGCLFGIGGENTFTYACSDATSSIEHRFHVNERKGNMVFELKLFQELSAAIKFYEISIRFDHRQLPYWQSLSDVSSWWGAIPVYSPSKVPDIARRPMYSTWYAFHSDLSDEKVLKQCEIAKELGCECVLIDDGWQSDSAKSGYTYVGDWIPENIKDPLALNKKIHSLGLKVIYWYSVPYIGEKANNFNRFKGKYLSKKDYTWADVWVLDPRFPDVRDFLIEEYVKAVKKWECDGLKLDFVDQFIPNENTPMDKSNGRDYASINEAVDKLMTDIMDTLRMINPEIMIEFRQKYTGPAMRKYGNMFRAHDCANSYVENRVLITDLRLLSGNTAVHSDMIMWNKNENVQTAALQLLNIIFSVPQISVLLDQIPADHQQMLKFWLDFWDGHRSTLLDGKFEALHPENSYPQVIAEGSQEIIIANYQSNMVVPIKKSLNNTIYIINASGDDFLTIDIQNTKMRSLQTYTCCGKQVLNQRNLSLSGIKKINVPNSGLLILQ